MVEALHANGGYLTLGRLYQETMRIPGCRWGTKTPFASIRRIVQQSPRKFRNRPGLFSGFCSPAEAGKNQFGPRPRV